VIEAAIEALRCEGGVVLYPTETVYGLGCRAADIKGADRIGALKGRGRQPLIVLVGQRPAGLPPVCEALADAFWPGPLTMIVPCDGRFPSEICGPDETVAIRWSPHPVVRQLVEAVGPITSTSANTTGEAPIVDVAQATLHVDAVLDVGPIVDGTPSTIVHYQKGILREGRLAGPVARILHQFGVG